MAMLSWLSPRAAPPTVLPRHEAVEDALAELHHAKAKAQTATFKALAADGHLETANSRVQRMLDDIMTEATTKREHAKS